MTKKANLWDQMKGEPAMWFGRFNIYKALGYTRTVEAAHREDPSTKGRRPARQWSDESKAWQWEERAKAWDHHVQLSADQELTVLAVERARVQHKLGMKMFKVAEAILDDKGKLQSAKTRDAARLADVASRLSHDALAAQRTDEGLSPQAPGAPVFRVIMPSNGRGDDEPSEASR